jgi:O-antigen/teichoic acid export membrane protein
MDRFFINRYLTPHDLGLYAVSYKVALLIQLPISAFQTAWGPFYLSIFKQKDAQQTYNTVLLLFTIIVSTFGLGIILFSKTLIFILAGEKYEAAYMPVFPIIMGLIMMSLGWILAIGIDLSKKSHLKFFSTITQLIVAGSSIYFLIPIYGLMGVGIGFLLGYLAYIIIETYMAYNAYHLRFDLYNPIIILSGVIALGVLSIITESESIVTQSIQGIIYLVVFLWFIWMVPLKRKNLFIVLKNIIR